MFEIPPYSVDALSLQQDQRVFTSIMSKVTEMVVGKGKTPETHLFHQVNNLCRLRPLLMIGLLYFVFTGASKFTRE